MKNKITAIVLAAGQGKRMNSPVAKQFLALRGKPVLYYSLMSFEISNVDDIILVTGKDQVKYCKENIVDYYHISKVSRVIEGGRERYDSVYNALTALSDTEYVLIHDGARPFITSELINNVVDQVKKNKACIVGTPVKETIKAVDVTGVIINTPDRNTLWAAQTPQAFEYSLIRKAYDMLYKDEEALRAKITDDAMVYEKYLKLPVKMITGEYNNLKITTKEDLVLAEALAENLF